jgi:uncharacterized membrane protein YgcG
LNGVQDISAKDNVERELFRPYGEVRPRAVPPPTYEESLLDLPPDYTNTDSLAAVDSLCLFQNVFESFALADAKSARSTSTVYVDIDLSKVEGIRQHANKKAKQAAKKAQQAKWMDSDNEENKDGTADGGDGGDANGGGDAGGGGADPPGGGDGGDEDDWWNSGPKKKKDKKKKKNAW